MVIHRVLVIHGVFASTTLTFQEDRSFLSSIDAHPECALGEPVRMKLWLREWSCQRRSNCHHHTCRVKHESEVTVLVKGQWAIRRAGTGLYSCFRRT